MFNTLRIGKRSVGNVLGTIRTLGPKELGAGSLLFCQHYSRPQETPSFPQEKDNPKAESCQTPDFMDLEFDRFNGGETSDIFVHTKQYIPDAPLEGPVDLDPEFDRDDNPAVDIDSFYKEEQPQ